MSDRICATFIPAVTHPIQNVDIFHTYTSYPPTQQPLQSSDLSWQAVGDAIPPEGCTWHYLCTQSPFLRHILPQKNGLHSAISNLEPYLDFVLCRDSTFWILPLRWENGYVNYFYDMGCRHQYSFVTPGGRAGKPHKEKKGRVQTWFCWKRPSHLSRQDSLQAQIYIRACPYGLACVLPRASPS
jgi:hypothetical protein